MMGIHKSLKQACKQATSIQSYLSIPQCLNTRIYRLPLQLAHLDARSKSLIRILFLLRLLRLHNVLRIIQSLSAINIRSDQPWNQRFRAS